MDKSLRKKEEFIYEVRKGFPYRPAEDRPDGPLG